MSEAIFEWERTTLGTETILTQDAFSVIKLGFSRFDYQPNEENRWDQLDDLVVVEQFTIIKVR